MKYIELIKNKKNGYVQVDLLAVKSRLVRVKLRTIMMPKEHVQINKIVIYKKEKYKIICWEELDYDFVFVKGAAK